MLKAPHTNDDNTKYDPCWQTNLFIEYELDVLEFKCFQKKYRYLALCIRSLRNYLIHEFQVYGSSAHNHGLVIEFIIYFHSFSILRLYEILSLDSLSLVHLLLWCCCFL